MGKKKRLDDDFPKVVYVWRDSEDEEVTVDTGKPFPYKSGCREYIPALPAESEIERLTRENSDLRKANENARESLTELLRGKHCPYCNDYGATTEGDPENPHQEQCEWCWTIPDSLFRAKCNAEAFLEAK